MVSTKNRKIARRNIIQIIHESLNKLYGRLESRKLNAHRIPRIEPLETRINFAISELIGFENNALTQEQWNESRNAVNGTFRWVASDSDRDSPSPLTGTRMLKLNSPYRPGPLDTSKTVTVIKGDQFYVHGFLDPNATNSVGTASFQIFDVANGNNSSLVLWGTSDKSTGWSQGNGAVPIPSFWGGGSPITNVRLSAMLFQNHRFYDAERTRPVPPGDTTWYHDMNAFFDGLVWIHNSLVDGDAAPNAVSEDSAHGTYTGVSAFVGGYLNYTYSLDDDAGGRFWINSSGQVMTGNLNTQNEQTYSIKIRASYGVESVVSDWIPITVQGVNDPPNGGDSPITILEDSTYAFSSSDFPFTDPDVGDYMSGVRIDTLPSRGALRLAGNSVAPGQVIATPSIPALTYIPNENENGLDYTSFTFSVIDAAGAADTTPARKSINVTAVNDPPVRTAGNPSPISVLEDSANTTAVSLGLSSLSYGPGGGSDENTQTLTYTITAIPSAIQIFKADGTTGVLVNQTVSLLELQGLKYKTIPDANGSGSLTWTIKDNGGTANGGVDKITNSLSVTVTAVNDAPVRTASFGPMIVLEDSANVTPSPLFPVPPNYGPGGGPDEADQIISITFTSIPAFIRLYKADGVTEVVVNQPISLPEFQGLKYKTVPNANGSGSLTWIVTDNGGTANGGSNSIFDSLLFTVLPVNDAPVRTAGNPSPISVLEDSANTTAVSLGLSSLNYGPGGGSDENTQTLTYTITAIPSAIQIFKADGTTGVLVNQTVSLLELQGLKYKTIPNANGSGSLTWSIKDNGGTSNGGVDTTTDSLSVTVTAVNDAPVRTAGNPSPISVLEDSANTTAVTLGLSSLNYGPGGGSDENTQTLTYTITAIPSAIQIFKADGTTGVLVNQTVSLLELQGLKYKTIPNANGSGSLTWTIKDNGGTSNGGVDTTTDSLSVTVTAVNDAPVRTAGNPSPISVLEDSANTTAVTLGLSSLNYGPGGGSDENTQTLTYTITAIPSAIQIFKADGTTGILVNQTVSLLELQGLKYKTVPNANGSGSLTWTIKDNGGTANGGVDTATDSLSVTVTAVNDAPVRTAGNYTPISVLEDSANTTAVSLGLSSLNYGPGGGSDENTQTLTYTITAIPSAIQIFKADGTTGILVNQTVSLLELQGLKYKTVPNTNGSGSLTWTIKDNGGTANGGVDTATDSLSVTVTSVNDAPVRTAGNPSPISVLEDSANTTAVTLGLSSLNYGPGGGSDENTQTLSFTIVAIPSAIRVFKNDGTTQVLVQQSVTLLELQGLMYKTHPNAFGTGKLEWDVKDNGGTANGGKDTLRDFLNITVTPVNDAPTDITLTPNSIPENAAPNSTVGTLRSIDADTGNTFSYALVAGLGDNDNSAFRISGSLLRTSQSFDYEAKSSYSIRVKSTDQGGLSTQKVLVINVTDVNDAPRFVDPEYEFEVADGTRQDNGSQANNGQWRPSISRDGRFVAFVSYATNLAANDFEMDVFVKDTFSGNVVEVSNTQSGGRSNGDSFNPTITPDGRFVVFESYASNLVPEDTSPTGDIFLRDLQTGTLERISTSSTGTAGNDRSYSPSVSDDGRFVAFRSDANNLVDGDTNGKGDIFIKDRLTGELSRVSNAFDGSQGNNHSFEPAISGDGNKVAFRSYASNLVAGADNNFEDIYVKDLRTGTILRANTSTDGQQGNNAVWVPSLSYDGRFLSFPSTATNLVSGDTNAAWDVFLKDLNTGETTRVSTTVNGTQGNGASNYATISGDGRYVTFLSFASNLVPDDTNGKEDVFIKDTLTGTITRVSTSSDRTQANDASSEAFVSAAGNLVAFTSTATNLVPNDTNGVPDIFIKNLITGETKLAVGNNSRVLIGQVSGTDQDANSVLRYTLTGPGADAFVINPITGEIELSSTGVMDFNLQPTYALTALVSDGVLSSTVPVTIHVTNGNNRPTDILLSSSSIEENMEENTLVGSLSVLDPNPGDVHIYQLVEGLGSDDNVYFFIEGTNLRAVGSFDFETKSSYSIRIRATDQGDLFKEKIFTIRVVDVDEGFPLVGTTANDAFVATYTGDGIVHAWSVTRNGTLLFNGTLPNTSLLIDGLGGTDTLDVVGRIADDVIQLDGSQLFINTAKLRFPRIESVRIQAKEGNDSLTVTTPLPSGLTGSFDGGTGLDLLEAIAGANVWNVLGTDSGSLNSNLTFAATETIQGGANEDQFVLSALGKTTGKILGGGGIDTLSLAAKTLAHTINLQTNTATSTGGIGGIESFIGSTSATVFDVLIGANSDTNWNIQGTDQGTLSSAVSGTVAFTGFESLTGGTSRDSFVFSDAGRLTKTLTGGTATGVNDTVDLSGKTTALEFRLDGTSTLVPGSIGTYTGIEILTGNNHSNTKVSRSSNTATTWAVDALGNIVVLGASYANVPVIAGGPGADTLTGPALASSAVQWIIDSANGGSISLPSIKTLAFTSMNGLTGGTGDDVFEIQTAGSISSNLSGGTGTGINALSYSQWTSGVSVNLSVSTVANATAIGGVTSNFQMVTGGSGDDSLRGNASKATVLIGLAGNDSLVGGTQRDILLAGLGSDLLQGGNGDDLLISGRTSYDLNFDAMKGVLAEWTSTRTFAQRTANLWGNGTGTRSNSDYFLNSQPSDAITDTVFADTDNDSLSGGLNQDWFFASLNDLTDFTGTGTAPDRLDP